MQEALSDYLRSDAAPPPALFDKVTREAQQALANAASEAERLHHAYIGTEHLLLPLARGWAEPTRALHVDWARLRMELDNVLHRAPASNEAGLTARLQTALRLAIDEAQTLGHQAIGPEHLLLGILREGTGPAPGVLQTFGVTVDTMRDMVIRHHTQRERTLAATAERAAATRGVVVMCRLSADAVATLDMLIDAGVCSTRSDAAAWLIQEGIDANASLFESVSGTVAQIRRLRETVQMQARQRKKGTVSPSGEASISNEETPMRGPLE
jgi:ATP-dependent Clp protease ATP-binding subunit ClpA